ncbi:MAG: FAD-dependent oxidoreductase [Actinomycetota bacterium]
MVDPGMDPMRRRTFVSSGMAAVAALLLTGCGDDDADEETDDGPADGSTVDDSETATAARSTATAPADDDAATIDDSGDRVIVIGAGPAGMSAAHLLRQEGVDVTVLEAGPTHGGRIRHDLEFTDFPIPLGAEWMHVPPGILPEIVNDDSVEITTEIIEYRTDDTAGFFDGTLSLFEVGDFFASDRKFVGSSWLDFFDTYIVPGIADTFVFDTPIVEIDHSGEGVVLTDSGGDTHEAAAVIVTVPLKLLQLGDVSFVPPLDDDRLATIDEANVWSGLKAFVEFDEAFYPAALSFPDSFTAEGQRLYYDAAYGQNSDANVLGLFSVGAQAERYQAVPPDELIDVILAELDEVFDGVASPRYVKHLVQNWNDEPFARAAYLADDESSATSTRLSRPIGGTVYFAGDAYTAFDDWSAVHTAARSAADAVDDLLG